MTAAFFEHLKLAKDVAQFAALANALANVKDATWTEDPDFAPVFALARKLDAELTIIAARAEGLEEPAPRQTDVPLPAVMERILGSRLDERYAQPQQDDRQDTERRR